MVSATKWIILISTLIIDHSTSKENPTVKLLNGFVSGTHDVSYNGRTFSAFYGIPYAKPPVGDLRFEPPQRVSNWTGTWVADSKIICLQVYNSKDNIDILGDEDCLYLNVFVPREKPSASDKLDVMVDIHGGSFMLGSGVYYAGPNFLMDRELVFVTINYRLGPFGFLSTEDHVVPGNNGLKDQSFALKWVRENIAAFGGNPDSVTLTGLSAGGASVHYHYLSPLSKGYFHRGISFSGTALDPWAFQESALKKVKTLAGFVGCDSGSNAALVACLKQRSALSIIENVKKFFQHNVVPFSIFSPIVEKNNPDAFLTDTPYNLLLRGEINDVPWITSFTKDEGIFPAAYFFDKLSTVEENWNEFAPLILDYQHTVSPDDSADVAGLVKDFYFKDSALTPEILIKINSDRHFAAYMEKAARLQAKSAKSPVYTYVFKYRGNHSIYELYGGSLDDYGVAHGDDVQYFFTTFLTDPKLTDSDELMKDWFLNMISSYASKGKPDAGDLKWEPVGEGKAFQYLNIRGPRDITLEKTEELTPLAFWDSLPLKENERLNRFRDEL